MSILTEAIMSKAASRVQSDTDEGKALRAEISRMESDAIDHTMSLADKREQAWVNQCQAMRSAGITKSDQTWKDAEMRHKKRMEIWSQREQRLVNPL
jgi:hypothetical protein